jgi:hypothetical protein
MEESLPADDADYADKNMNPSLRSVGGRSDTPVLIAAGPAPTLQRGYVRDPEE